jgi:quinoprotein glucose dehydrogenase
MGERAVRSGAWAWTRLGWRSSARLPQDARPLAHGPRLFETTSYHGAAMPSARHLGLALTTLALPLAAQAQFPEQHDDSKAPMYVAPASSEAKDQIATFTLAPGLQAQLVAAEPDLCNVVAFAVDEQGRIFVSETFRIHDGVFDTREYMQWKDDDLACLQVADRVAKYQKHISKDIPGYARLSERVKLLLDENKDGVVDKSVVFADGFADLADGIASGVLPIGKDVWFTDIPRLWRLRDDDGDGKAEHREAVFEGFGVHTSLIGHDLHGLVLGPDRRLYFSIGDRGFNVTTKEGTTLAFPHEGAVLRCELDGSKLEVVHRGLRNPQELAFDDQGNLFTGDNNSDGGDRARFVQITEGADSGWRIGFQWLDDRGAWNREKLWWPQHPGQPAWILPPLMNIADGPSGLAFDPGLGLPARYRGCFFLCDFRGGSSYSGVHALRLSPKGAGFEPCFRDKPIWGVLATDVDFAPDGALLVSDWVSGWNKTGKGRIYRVEQPGQRNDLQLRAASKLLASDFGARTDAQLLELLHHQERRIRQHAQFALVDRGARAVLLAAAKERDDQRARLCGAWGLGILGRADRTAVADLVPLLADGDADVRAQTAKVLGDARFVDARSQLVDALDDGSLRVRREAALALGKLGAADGNTNSNADGDATTAALLAALADDGGRDAVLRHALAFGLAGTTAPARLLQERDHADAAVRLGVLLALRRVGDGGVAAFLADREPRLRAEAARAIYDGGIDAALPQLAAVLTEPAADDPALAWRALNAARLRGSKADAAAIAAYALQAARPAAMRKEAVRILGEWRQPHGQDRVLGNWRPCHHDDVDAAVAAFAPRLCELFAADEDLAAAAADACKTLHFGAAGKALAQLAGDGTRPARARTAALKALAALDDPAVDAIVAAITGADPTSLRTAAVALFAERAPQKAAPVLATLCEHAELRERQTAFASLGTLKDPAGGRILLQWLDALQHDQVDAAVQLDLLLAAQQRSEAEVAQRLQAIAQSRPAGDPLAEYRPCRDGGDVEAGRRVFFDNEATRCTRCHTVSGEGGHAGPVLDGIGSRQTRDYLLESLVLPSKQIATGFATTLLELHNGDLVAGVVTKDQDGAVWITGVDGNEKQVAWDRIRARRPASDSAMPVMAGPLDKRQLRDVIAFLASLQASAPAAK